MNNLDWLCENDREALAAMIAVAENDGCEHCIYDSEADCGVRCGDGITAWLEAEHSDGSAPENGVSAEDVDANGGKPDIDTREKLEADVWQILNSAYMFAWMHGNENRRGGSFKNLHREFYNLLDRQAAITERECAERIRCLEAKLRECDEQRIEYCHQRNWYRIQRDEFRKKLGDAVWHAQAIARMTKVDA